MGEVSSIQRKIEGLPCRRDFSQRVIERLHQWRIFIHLNRLLGRTQPQVNGQLQGIIDVQGNRSTDILGEPNCFDRQPVFPIGSKTKLNVPAVPDLAECSAAVLRWVNTTVAFGTGAPRGSLNRPSIRPVVS